MTTAVQESPQSAEILNVFNLPSGSKATEIQLELPKRLKFEEWEEVTDGLIKAEESSQWLVGDALLFGRNTYGEDYAQVIDVSKLKRSEESTIRGYLWVSENVHPVLRRTRLKWYHHKEIAKFPPEIQKKWLDLAEANGWTVRELRANIQSMDDDDQDEEDAIPELLVLEDPVVREFISDYQRILRATRDSVPEGVPSMLNLIDGQIGQAQWQLDRSDKEEAGKILEAIDEGWQAGQEIFNWLQKRSFFMRESELEVRLAWMCEPERPRSIRLREVKQGGRKENQRGDLTSMYVKHNARTGDAFTASKGNSIYAMGEKE